MHGATPTTTTDGVPHTRTVRECHQSGVYAGRMTGRDCGDRVAVCATERTRALRSPGCMERRSESDTEDDNPDDYSGIP